MRRGPVKSQSFGTAFVAGCTVILAIACVVMINAFANSSHRQGQRAELRSAVVPSLSTANTVITIDGGKLGSVFDGVGAISGGGGNSRLLIDYLSRHPQQAQQILDYLFKPDYGASLQILKLEIGGDAYATDGAEPSVEHTKGSVNCGAGYEFWLARQARLRNPNIQLEALQWNAPIWVGEGSQNAWTNADIGYIIDWLDCARANGLYLNEIGGWNEHLPNGVTPQVMAWFIKLRATLDAAGYSYVKIVAVDSFAHLQRPDVAKFLAGNPAFAQAVDIIGYHDICRKMAVAGHCFIPRAARQSGKPIWETEVGALQAPGGLGTMARSINNGYIQAGVTGTLEWPLLSSMPADLPLEDQGLILASEPWSGSYQVQPLIWVIAQTTQFTAPGWRHVLGADGALRLGGSYVSYAAPNAAGWSLVAQTSDASGPQTIGVRVLGGLPNSQVHVWSTRLTAGRASSGWFARQANVHPTAGAFEYQLQPGYVYTFTTTTGQHKGTASSPASAPMPLPYSAFRDPSGEPWSLGAINGAFEYLPGSTTTFAQTAHGIPDLWEASNLGKAAQFPYAIVGGQNWRDYTVSTQVRFTGQGQSAGLIARYSLPSFAEPLQPFHGYALTVSTTGQWQLLRSDGEAELPLASGKIHGLGAGAWHTVSLSAHGAVLAGRIDGHQVTSVTNGSYSGGIAGIMTGAWYDVQFRDLKVTT